jgi:3-isopropylmalate/(R)-2-methylmalate dehydratase small subunit
MTPFSTLSGIAAPLELINVDTDMIIPKQYLKTIKRTGLGVHLFDEMRYDDNGKPVEDFILNIPPFTNAEILVGGANFGCGSSREHAPWALLDFGIRCIIAPSFADIFYNNCFKNGILPIYLEQGDVDELIMHARGEQQFTIDLQEQMITAAESIYRFDIDAFRKHCLYNGLDDIGLTFEQADSINAFEARNRKEAPWLYAG